MNSKGIKVKQKGITLVALVVTIIILLILAGVTISQIGGNNGLFSRVRQAVEKYKEASEDETDMITELENYIDKNKIKEKTYTIIYDTNEGQGNIETQTKVEGQVLKITEKKPTREGYTFLGWAESKEKAEDKKEYYKSGDNFTKDENITLYAVWVKNFVLADGIGKYIDYKVDLDGIDENYDWKIFYQGTEEDGEANGRIFIIAADYVPTNNPALVIATDSDHANMQTFSSSEFNVFCKHWISVPANLQEMTKNNLFMATKYPLNGKTNNNAKAVSALLNTDNWESFLDKDEKGNKRFGEYAIGGPTIELWCAAWNTLIPESGIDENGFVKITPTAVTGDFGYKLSSIYMSNKLYLDVNGTQTQPNNYTILSTTEKYKVFFSQSSQSVTANGQTGKCNGYWLASPSADANSCVMLALYMGRLYCDGQAPYSGYGNLYDSLRPLVCLKPGVILDWDDAKQVYTLKE